MRLKKIAVIGAGLSGLVTAKTLLEYGYDVQVYEKENEIGGVWAPSRHYPGLTIQNTRDTYAFSDFRMPKHYPEFPTGEQMLAYLKSYADNFALTPYINLNHEVLSAIQTESGLWKLLIRNEQKGFNVEVDFLVVCSGTFSEPFIPQTEGMENFINAGGSVFHTTKVNSPDLYKNKKVAVVGFGKSACDITSSIAECAQKTYIIFREPKWKVPKKILGINYKYIILSRFGEALTKLKYRNFVENIIHTLKIPSAALGFMQKVFAKQQSLKTANLIPDVSITDMLHGELSVESDGLYKKVVDKKITAVRGEIKSYAQNGIELSNGEKLDVDLVIYGTGFKQTLKFLSDEMIKKFTDSKGDYLLYRNILPVDVPGLAFVGYNSSFFCNLSSEMGALWLAEYLKDKIALPSKEEMKSQVTEHLNWRRKFRQNALYKNASVYPFNITYVDQLLKDMKAKLPLGSLLSEWLVVVEPANYAPVKQKIMQRN
ncbi:MAG: hypothetical protein A2068_14150 [Ignavibacteria bacterium GWB2_35_6b]|nr:MAG: hypothetical protein A2068_14150 [Ignavibacteria bacterium GWB2_35_6b]